MKHVAVSILHVHPSNNSPSIRNSAYPPVAMSNTPSESHPGEKSNAPASRDAPSLPKAWSDSSTTLLAPPHNTNKPASSSTGTLTDDDLQIALQVARRLRGDTDQADKKHKRMFNIF